ncbi:hypothetical protein CDN97_21715 [Pantoea sp. AMG 501]|nr:hypothetical protein CDN97_21715 [Pantoea sp. AMG 501]
MTARRKARVVKRDDEAAAQASGAVITHGADAKTERKRDGSKCGGGSANGGGGALYHEAVGLK